MISMTSISSSGGCAKYMTDQATTEYYAGQAVPSEWHGHGAEIQGLAGKEVSTEALTKQLDGKVMSYDKETDTAKEVQLGRTKIDKETGEKTTEHRAGWDMTFAAPKSVSIESEVYGKEDVRQAHENAVHKAMSFLEDKAAQTRIDGKFENTGNLTYASFQHSTSRAGDPQTHTHCIVSNVTYDQNGKAYSLSNEKLMDYRTTADNVYKNELANELKKLGYEVEFNKNGKETSFEISGYTKENLEEFSKRSEQIKDALADRGLDKDTASHSARQTAALDTRADKDHPENAEAHRDKWQAEAKESGIAQAERKEPEKLTRDERIANAQEAVAKAIDHLSEREQAFSEKDLWKSASSFAEGKTNKDSLDEAVRLAEKDGTLIAREDGKYTTKDAIDSEKHMADRLSQGVGAHEQVMNSQEFDKALAKFEEKQGFPLGEEQRNASRMILTGEDRFQGVQGLAGTGKTTMLTFIREAAESKGWEVKGFSNGGAQADKMQAESGIQSSTTKAFLIENDKLVKDSQLAERAIETKDKNSGFFGKEPDFKALAKGVDKGEVKLEFDSEKRAYFTTKEGDTYTKSLYQGDNTLTSKNVNHLGLSETKYALAKDGSVFKSGGSVTSELAGSLKEKFNSGEKAESMPGKVAEWATNKALTSGEQWEKVKGVEAMVVRDEIRDNAKDQTEKAYSYLKAQAGALSGETKKTLNICDEASMSGQKEFNNVVKATEQQGARTVFLGDEKQHQAVEAGKGFELAQKHMPTAELGQDSIRRQRTDHTIEAVSKILDGKHDEAVKGLQTKEYNTNQTEVKEAYSKLENPTKQETAAYRDDLKEASKADNKETIQAIAKDYVNSENRDKTLVISSTNADRTAINQAVREEMKGKGELQDSKKIDTLEKTGLTSQEQKQAVNYDKGQIVEFTAKLDSKGIEKGDQFKVDKVDTKTNTVFASNGEGKQIAFDPSKVQGKELFNESKGKEFATGEKVAFTKNDKDLNVKNGQIGVVEKIDGNKMTIRMEDKSAREIDTKSYKHLDHGYAMTSHKSQGQTFDKVLVHHNTDAKHGDRETYVNVTRARDDVKVYTQNADKASSQFGQKMDKETAQSSAPSAPALSKETGKEQVKETSTVKEPKAKDTPAQGAREGQKTEQAQQKEPSKDKEASSSKEQPKEASTAKESTKETPSPKESAKETQAPKEVSKHDKVEAKVGTEVKLNRDDKAWGIKANDDYTVKSQDKGISVLENQNGKETAVPTRELNSILSNQKAEQHQSKTADIPANLKGAEQLKTGDTVKLSSNVNGMAKDSVCTVKANDNGTYTIKNEQTGQTAIADKNTLSASSNKMETTKGVETVWVKGKDGMFHQAKQEVEKSSSGSSTETKTGDIKSEKTSSSTKSESSKSESSKSDSKSSSSSSGKSSTPSQSRGGGMGR